MRRHREAGSRARRATRKGGRGRAWSSASSAAPPEAAGALGALGIRTSLRPGLAGARRSRAGPACLFSPPRLAAHCFPPLPPPPAPFFRP